MPLRKVTSLQRCFIGLPRERMAPKQWLLQKVSRIQLHGDHISEGDIPLDVSLDDFSGNRSKR